jgi:putative GTP pyrophosphokinase
VTKEEQLLVKWRSERDTYEAWGNHLLERMRADLALQITPISVSYFLKTNEKPRLKGEHKFIEKAFYRNKNYSDPYNDITDKVGVRFVVLLGSDVKTVVRVLESIQGWSDQRIATTRRNKGAAP